MSTAQSNGFEGVLRTARTIVGSLAAGIVFFLIVVFLFLDAQLQEFDPQAVISMAMVAFAATTIIVRFLVPGRVARTGCQRISAGTWGSDRPDTHRPVPDTDEGKLLQVYLSQSLIGAAVLEGGAFGNLVAFMLEGQAYSLVLALLFWLGLLLSFPTRSGLTAWLRVHTERLKEIQRLEGRISSQERDNRSRTRD